MWDGGLWHMGQWYIATFTILSLFAYFFCLYHPYILLISLEIFFVLLVYVEMVKCDNAEYCNETHTCLFTLFTSAILDFYDIFNYLFLFIF